MNKHITITTAARHVACAIAATAAIFAKADAIADLSDWRIACATKGFAAVIGKTRVPADVRQMLWEAYREHLGYDRVQMGRPTLVSSNAWGGIYDLPFETEDGAKHHLGVFLADDARRPVYWTGERSSVDGAMPLEGMEQFIDECLCPNGRGESFVSSCGNLSMDAVVTLGFGDERLESPFEEFNFIFLDDHPHANWGHPARCVFMAPDFSKFAVLYVDMPVKVEIGGREVEMHVWGSNSADTESKAPNMPRLAANVGAAGGKGAFPSIAGGDASNCYALLVSGGGDTRNNHGRYWSDICFAYNVLRKSYNLPRANIKVLWASGDPSKDLCWKTGKCCWKTCLGANDFPSANLSDFDQDGNNDIAGAATYLNFSNVLKDYASSLASTDQLFIFVTDHGDESISLTDKEPAKLCMWGGTSVSDVQFASLTKGIKCPVMVALETCYSGGMVEEFISSSNNRVIATADGFDSSECGNFIMDVWVYNFFSALCGHYPSGTYFLDNKKVASVDVRSVGAACNADTDGDGRISFSEAAHFAINSNPIRNDHPENHSSTANLGKKLFMTKYADSPGVVVKDKVLAPSLNPATGEIGFAPATVTAFCATPGATIRYTTNGSEPTARSAVYSGGISISKDTTVSVRAFKSGMEPSDTVTIAYSITRTAPQKAVITSVSQGDSSSGIVLNWLPGAGTATSDLLRSESSSMTSAKTIASGLSASVTTYADLTAAPGKTYYYQIKSKNSYGSTLSAASLAAYLMLNPPSGVKAETTAIRFSSASVKVSWNAVGGASHYRVWRKSPDGAMTALGYWQEGLAYVDTVLFDGAATTYTYYVKSATSSSGACASAYSGAALTVIEPSTSGWSLVLSTSWFDEPTDLFLSPGSSKEFSCRLRYADGTTETSGFINSPYWSVKEGNGVSLSYKNGSASSFGSIPLYTPPSLSVAVSPYAQAQAAILTATFTTPAGSEFSQDFRLIISGEPVPKELVIEGPGFAVPGETLPLKAHAPAYGDSSWYGIELDSSEVEWAVVGGSGATIDEYGELTAWPVTSKTSVTIQGSIDTILGPVMATKTFSVSPSTITKKTAVIPPLGGASTNYIGKLDKETFCECTPGDWITGTAYHGSPTTNPSDISCNITLGRGRNAVALYGQYLFFSLIAGRNPGKDRETLFKLRWDGGGIDFTVIQQEAPYANNPIVNGGATSLSAKATTDGAVLHYATDGEEPSDDSPVLNGILEFDEDTECAVKAFGAWMQASDTVYADVVGKGTQWDEIEVSFHPGQPGLSTPSKRTYKVNESFGDLPVLPKTNGLFFKGWTLSEGSGKRVKGTDAVPSSDATLYAVWSPVSDDKPEWVALPWNFTSGMMAYVIVSNVVTGAILPPEEGSVGIEDADGVCRGSTDSGLGNTASPLNGQGGMHVFGVYGNVETGTESGLKIRVWGNSDGFLAVVNPCVPYSADGELGSETEPYVIDVGNMNATITLDRQGGSKGTASVTATYGSPMPKITIPTKSGCSFGGYWTEPNGEGTQYYTAAGASARDWDGLSDTPLYAYWTKSLSSLSISGPASVASAGTATYTCTATYSDKSTETVAAEWSLSAGASYGSIDPATGVFTALSATAKRSVTVKASFGGKSATKTVTITARTLASIAVSGPDEIASLESGQYSCAATYSDGTAENVSATWTLPAGGAYASVVKNTGAVTSKNEGEANQAATLRAAFGGKTADKAITLLAKEPPRPQDIYYVDAANGSDANDGRSWETARRTIQSAIDSTDRGDLVLVAEGAYAPIDATGKKVEVRAMAGGEAAVIDGGGTRRSATLGDHAVLSGFVLRNGFVYGGDGGGALGGVLEACVIESCAAEMDEETGLGGNGGGIAECYAENCEIVGCEAGGFGGGAYHATLTGCTVYGNSATAGAGVAGCTVQNSIVWENRLYETDKKGVRKLGNCANVTEGRKTLIKNACTYTDSSPKPAGSGNLAKDPMFVDAANGDFRLQYASPVKNKGKAALAAGDLDRGGLPRVVGVAPDMGAHEMADGTPVPADYDGDGVTDATYFDDATATWMLMQSRDGLLCVQFGEAKATPVPADYDGDGRADFATYSATAKAPAFRILTQAGDELDPIALGEKGATPFAADVDGDGKADPCVFQGNAKKPSFTALLSGNGHDAANARALVFGTKGAKPVAGDFDGDGKVDIGCYAATASKPAFSVVLSSRGWNDKAPLSVTLGAKGSEPCCGDFDGDGTTDFAAYSGTAKAPLLYRMFSTAKWREVRTLPFGEKGSRAAIGDWDGDGAADAAIEFHGRWWRATGDWDAWEIPAP